MCTRKSKWELTVALAVLCLVVIEARVSRAQQYKVFSPSNARTEDGKLIPADQFFPAARCASCHTDTHKAWSESLHRNSGREPFYKESVDILQRARGSEPAQHCESCHSPIAVLSGALF